MDDRAKYEAARDALRKINAIIYAAGAPLGTNRYFAIREIAAKYEREGLPPWPLDN